MEWRLAYKGASFAACFPRLVVFVLFNSVLLTMSPLLPSPFFKLRTQKSGLFATCCFFYAWNWFLYYRFYIMEYPVISYKRTYWNVTIAERAKLSSSMFAAFPFLTSTHMQTVMCTICAEFGTQILMRPLVWDEDTFLSFDGNSFSLYYYKLGDLEKVRLHRYFCCHTTFRVTAAVTLTRSLVPEHLGRKYLSGSSNYPPPLRHRRYKGRPLYKKANLGFKFARLSCCRLRLLAFGLDGNERL